MKTSSGVFYTLPVIILLGTFFTFLYTIKSTFADDVEGRSNFQFSTSASKEKAIPIPTTFLSYFDSDLEEGSILIPDINPEDELAAPVNNSKFIILFI